MARKSMSFVNNRFQLGIMTNVGDSYSAGIYYCFFD